MYVDEFLKKLEYHIFRTDLARHTFIRLFEKSPKTVLERVTFQMLPAGGMPSGRFSMYRSLEYIIITSRTIVLMS